MARRNNDSGISPTVKLVIIAVLFGVPILFFASSYGLGVLAERVPMAAVAIIAVVATAYTAHTATLMYTYYEVQPPVLRFIPCICEVTLMDQKYWKICYGLYAGVLLFGAIAFLPYSISSILGTWFVENHTFIFGIIACLLLVVIQVVKGIGLIGCINDIANDWESQTRADVGFIKKFSLLAFIPFVRVVALYSLNKPLDTMVTYMNVTISDAEDDGETFYEEGEEGEE